MASSAPVARCATRRPWLSHPTPRPSCRVGILRRLGIRGWWMASSKLPACCELLAPVPAGCWSPPTRPSSVGITRSSASRARSVHAPADAERGQGNGGSSQRSIRARPHVARGDVPSERPAVAAATPPRTLVGDARAAWVCGLGPCGWVRQPARRLGGCRSALASSKWRAEVSLLLIAVAAGAGAARGNAHTRRSSAPCTAPPINALEMFWEIVKSRGRTEDR